MSLSNAICKLLFTRIFEKIINMQKKPHFNSYPVWKCHYIQTIMMYSYINMYNKLQWVNMWVYWLWRKHHTHWSQRPRWISFFFFKCQLNLIFTDWKDSYSITIFHKNIHIYMCLLRKHIIYIDSPNTFDITLFIFSRKIRFCIVFTWTKLIVYD